MEGHHEMSPWTVITIFFCSSFRRMARSLAATMSGHESNFPDSRYGFTQIVKLAKVSYQGWTPLWLPLSSHKTRQCLRINAVWSSVCQPRACRHIGYDRCLEQKRVAQWIRSEKWNQTPPREGLRVGSFYDGLPSSASIALSSMMSSDLK